MAYVSGFQHDLFISYAVVDNDGPYENKRGWVQAFEEQLKAELQREVNEKRLPDVWLDRKRLSCGDPFDNEIRDALQSNAVLVVLLPKQYLASEYCRMERETFLLAIAQQQDDGQWGQTLLFVLRAIRDSIVRRSSRSLEFLTRSRSTRRVRLLTLSGRPNPKGTDSPDYSWVARP